MNILTKETLPDTAEEYFFFYHQRAYESSSEFITINDFKNILEELRFAYRKYPKDKSRIESISKVIIDAIDRFSMTIEERKLKKMVAETLF